VSGIATYNAKRDFKKTAEPPGKVAAKRSRNLQFVIQKHDASRLHYDFRLEIGGVLASWAIPKGPSLDPGEKRLAVRTEDHPMAYGGFEGTIPAGEYGGGTVMLWDRGTWTPEGKEPAQAQLRKGSLKFALQGERLHGSFALVRMKPRKGEKAENWLLIKHGDEAAKRGSADAVVRRNTTSVASKRSMDEIAAGAKVWHSNRKKANGKAAEPPAMAKAGAKQKAVAKRKAKTVAPNPAKVKGARKTRAPRKVAPQLATLSEDAPEDSGWLSEIKFDGYRMVAHVDNGDVSIFSRNGIDWSNKLPELAASLAQLPVRQAWVDGEVVALNGEGHSSFSLLKTALSDKRTSQLLFYVFDLLYLDDYSLVDCAQADRKALLAQVLAEPPPRIRYSEHFEGVPERVKEQACAMQLEGVICKRADAPYRSDRNRNWLKLKCIQREEFVVVGYTDPNGSRTGFGALLMGYYDGKGALHYAGGVGSGFNEKTLAELHKRLQQLERKIGPRIIVHGEEGPPRGIHWVKPELVAELQFTEWTGDGVLRHATFLGLREDKEPMDVMREPPDSAGAGHALSAAAIVTARPPRSKAKGKKAGKAKADVPAIIDNRRDGDDDVRLSHPDRVLWPDGGLTKEDLAAYWQTMADLAIPHIAGRALALVRCPDGIEGEQFFQKKVSPGFPRQILDLQVGGERVLAIEDAEGLRALAQMSAIEIHPWGSLLDDIERPDRLVFDFDPDPSVGFARVVEAALMLRQALDEAGLKSFPKATGGKGLHVVVPIRPEMAWDEAKSFCHDVARWMVRSEPTRFTAELAKAKRRGRIFVDYLRNGRGATAIAPFSPRARPGAGFAMPIAWKDVKPTLDPKRYTLPEAAKFKAQAKAAWKGFFEVEQSIGAKARRIFQAK
jgi:bifunctional non-homologous end joining protein LigD